MKEFKFDTIQNFDVHISDSIKGYDLLYSLITNISSFYAKKDTTIIDLGCTTGKLISNLAERYPSVKCIGYDIIDKNFLVSTNATLIQKDVTGANFDVPEANIIMAIFLFQFLSYNDRIDLLKKIYTSLNNLGVFIVCEKEISNYGIFQEVFTFSNYSYKQQNFTSEEILEKEKLLRGSMSCLNFGANEQLFKEVGFTKVELFFQSLNFRGWICSK